MVEGYTHNVNMMAAGEYPLTIFMQVSKLDAMKRKEAPVDWVAGTPTLATISTVAMIKNPLHPAAAQLLIDFYLSLGRPARFGGGGKNSAPSRREKRVSRNRPTHGKRKFTCPPTGRRLRPVHEDLQRLLGYPLSLDLLT